MATPEPMVLETERARCTACARRWAPAQLRDAILAAPRALDAGAIAAASPAETTRDRLAALLVGGTVLGLVLLAVLIVGAWG